MKKSHQKLLTEPPKNVWLPGCSAFQRQWRKTSLGLTAVGQRGVCVLPGLLSCTLKLMQRRKQAQVCIADMLSFGLHTCTGHRNTSTPFLSPDSCPVVSACPPQRLFGFPWITLKGFSIRHRGKFLADRSQAVKPVRTCSFLRRCQKEPWKSF